MAEYIKSLGVNTYDTIRLADGQTMENIAYDYYGDANLHWVIILLNDIIDPYYDLPLSPKEIRAYAELAYTDVNDIHHYEYEGFKYPDFNALYFPITNLEHETKLNEDKRFIKILHPDYLNQIKNELDGLLYSN